MQKIVVTGGTPLNGEVTISGAKNAVLPILCATLLADAPVEITNVPHLHDVVTTMKLLGELGATISIDEGTLSKGSGITVDPRTVNQHIAPYELVKTMRASILVLGPLLAKFGAAEVSLPGGCAIGSRPVDQHIKGLQAMGADIKVEHGYIHASTSRLKGARITTDMVTVTGTENFLMAACLAEGETVLENAAQEPEITDLAEMLIKMGAKIEGHGSSRIRIQGVEKLHGCEHEVVADRIEAGTFLCAVAAAGGDVTLQNACAHHLDAVVEKLRDAGAELEAIGGPDCQGGPKAHAIHIRSLGGRALKGQGFRTTEYPGFPTDMQAQFMALNCVASGASVVTETIFENRFMHVNELVRLGANIHVDGRTAMIDGVQQLSGATVMATDLRASASLVIAGLVADGETLVDRIYHLDRGYDQMEEKLRGIGADIERVT